MALGITGSALAQTIDKSVIAAGGGSYAGSTLMADYTIGQAIASYATGTAYTVTEGFHPISYDATPSATPVISANTIGIQAYPNPASNVLHVSVVQSVASPVLLRITDVTGQTMRTMVLAAQTNANADIDLSALASGAYYILVNPGKENGQVMKFIKN